MFQFATVCVLFPLYMVTTWKWTRMKFHQHHSNKSVFPLSLWNWNKTSPTPPQKQSIIADSLPGKRHASHWNYTRYCVPRTSSVTSLCLSAVIGPLLIPPAKMCQSQTWIARILLPSLSPSDKYSQVFASGQQLPCCFTYSVNSCRGEETLLNKVRGWIVIRVNCRLFLIDTRYILIWTKKIWKYKQTNRCR